MGPSTVALVALALFGYALWSRSLNERSISGPMVACLVGSALGLLGLDLVDDELAAETLQILAEATLVVVLFSDATRIDLRRLRQNANLPIRMLSLGLPLTILFGAGVGAILFADFRLIEAAVLAAILSPTDAALGQAVVSDKRVPLRIRQALNVESGLNDGLMVPAITVLVAVAAAEAGQEGSWPEFVARQLGFGAGIGIVVGLCMGRVLDWSSERGLIEGAQRQIAVLMVAAAAYAGAEVLEGNGFVAAFVAGLAFGSIARDHCEAATDFAEDEGELLVLLTFLFWGVLLLAPRLDALTPAVALYIVLSLTVVRMIPVAVSLTGAGLEWPSTLYLGWFGPRGLASILFAQFAAEHLENEAAETILTVVTWTCFVSIVAHGLSAVPAAARYGAWFATMTDDQMASMPEAVIVPDIPTRGAMKDTWAEAGQGQTDG